MGRSIIFLSLSLFLETKRSRKGDTLDEILSDLVASINRLPPPSAAAFKSFFISEGRYFVAARTCKTLHGLFFLIFFFLLFFGNRFAMKDRERDQDRERDRAYCNSMQDAINKYQQSRWSSLWELSEGSYNLLTCVNGRGSSLLRGSSFAEANESGRSALIRNFIKPSLAGFVLVLLVTLSARKLQGTQSYSTASTSSSPTSPSFSSSAFAFEEEGHDTLLLAQDEKCMLSGKVSDCSCDYAQVESLNEEIVLPKLKELVSKRFFSYFKVDLHCKCPFWPEDGMCSMPACSVCECQDDQLPQHLVTKDILECKLPPPPPLSSSSNSNNFNSVGAQNGFSEKYESEVDRTVKEGVGVGSGMSWHASDNPWLLNHQSTSKDTSSGSKSAEEDFVYVDLHLNPERYTGYKGEHANRIWKAIYSQSCFHGLRESSTGMMAGSFPGLLLPNNDRDNQFVCKEKEVFYRLISGIHTSITAHIAAMHPKEICGGNQNVLQSKARAKPDLSPFGSNSKGFDPLSSSSGDEDCTLDERHWGPNLNLFYDRLGKQQHKARVENLYFTYLFTLQAALKAAPYLNHADYSTDHEDDDVVTKTLVISLLNNERVSKMCTKAFDEGKLWQKGIDVQITQEEMQLHFQNISQIMNCVGCEKCKLWGKLQISGLGTALKILFNVGDISQLVLRRNEVISLFNLLSRLSESLHTVSTFLCTLISQGYHDVIVPSSPCNM